MWTGFEPTLSAIPSELWSPSGVLASSVSTCTPIANWVLVGLLTWGNRIRGCYDLPTNRNRSDHVFKETAMTIGITGASGQLAGLTIEKVLDQVEPSELVLITRSPEKVEQLAQRGATVRAGDFDEPAGLPAALAGIERLLIVSADEGRQHLAAVDAAK